MTSELPLTILSCSLLVLITLGYFIYRGLCYLVKTADKWEDLIDEGHNDMFL